MTSEVDLWPLYARTHLRLCNSPNIYTHVSVHIHIYTCTGRKQLQPALLMHSYNPSTQVLSQEDCCKFKASMTT